MALHDSGHSHSLKIVKIKMTVTIGLCTFLKKSETDNNKKNETFPVDLRLVNGNNYERFQNMTEDLWKYIKNKKGKLIVPRMQYFRSQGFVTSRNWENIVGEFFLH